MSVYVPTIMCLFTYTNNYLPDSPGVNVGANGTCSMRLRPALTLAEKHVHVFADRLREGLHEL